MKSKLKHFEGFTLIELLVVIAIVGLLASIIFTSLNTARSRARDARRISDLQTLNSAIQIYIQDNGHAPYLGAGNCQASNRVEGLTGATCHDVSVLRSLWTDLGNELSPYISRLPTDPCGQNCNTDPNWAVYIYNPPASVAAYCDSLGACTVSNAEINSSYSIAAGVMEVDSPSFTTVFHGVPTFGFKNHSIGVSF